MKNRKGPKTDAESMAALEVMAIERQEEELKKLQLKKRETAIAQIMRLAGKIEAMNFSEAQSRFLKLILLKRVKDSKQYRDEFGLTWQQFCDNLCLERRTIDLHLEDLRPFTAEFLETFFHFSGVDFNKVKYLSGAISAGVAKIQGSVLIYDGEEIPLTPDRKDDIQAILEKIEEKYKRALAEAQQSDRAARRLLQDAQGALEKKEKRIDQLEGNARAKELTPDEDAFLRSIENHRIGFDGYMLTVDPERIDAMRDPSTTPRMRAAYIEALGYMRRQITAAHDTALTMYGADLAFNSERWHPPAE